MTPEQRKLIFGCTSGEISVEELVARLGVDPRHDRELVPTQLRESLANRSLDDVECALRLAFKFKLSRHWAPTFAALLDEDWHFSHEDLASCLQDIRDPATVDALYRCALKRLSYLAYDEAYALAVKCIWALHDIGTSAAVERLESLASCDVEPIREAASERLRALAQRQADDPVPAYRRARDAKMRSF